MVERICPECGEENPNIEYDDEFICANCKEHSRSALRAIIEDMEQEAEDSENGRERESYDFGR